MANKRTFKKFVDALGASVVEEMMIAYYNVEGADRKMISEAVGTVLDAVENAKSNSNVYFDKGIKAFEDKKQYSAEKKKFFVALFNKIYSDFDGEVQMALKKFNGALPAAVKEAQKKAVNEA